MSRRLEDSSDVGRAGEISSTLQILVLPCHFLSLPVDSVITERCSEEKKDIKANGVVFFFKVKNNGFPVRFCESLGYSRESVNPPHPPAPHRCRHSATC